jgi:hypothetical protein
MCWECDTTNSCLTNGGSSVNCSNATLLTRNPFKLDVGVSTFHPSFECTHDLSLLVSTLPSLCCQQHSSLSNHSQSSVVCFVHQKLDWSVGEHHDAKRLHACCASTISVQHRQAFCLVFAQQLSVALQTKAGDPCPLVQSPRISSSVTSVVRKYPFVQASLC